MVHEYNALTDELRRRIVDTPADTLPHENIRVSLWGKEPPRHKTVDLPGAIDAEIDSAGLRFIDTAKGFPTGRRLKDDVLVSLDEEGWMMDDVNSDIAALGHGNLFAPSGRSAGTARRMPSKARNRTIAPRRAPGKRRSRGNMFRAMTR